jgi:choloylglycine hydrolase
MKNCFFLLILFFISRESRGCTCFVLHHHDKMVFGRNYDWVTDAGMVCTNQRGLAKTSFRTRDGNSIGWVSKYGSISFNQYGKEFPTGGMNEMGLVVELMWLDGTRYPVPDARPSITALQWIQFQLDNHASVEEVIASDQQLRISSLSTPLHFLVADGGGHVASIEFINGNMTVHNNAGLPMPVLTNTTYDLSIAGYKNRTYQGDNSLERFSTACDMISRIRADSGRTRPLVDEAFGLLEKVAQGDFTRWSIVYDITEKKIWFRTQQHKQLRSVSFSAFDFSCGLASKMINMNGREHGEISNRFSEYSDAGIAPILAKSAEQSSPKINFGSDQQRSVLAYAGTISCK